MEASDWLWSLLKGREEEKEENICVASSINSLRNT